VDALAKETKGGSGFKVLVIRRDGQLGNSFINNLSSIVARSELHEIWMWMREDSGRVHILESIQWKHLRELDIRLKAGTFETSVMRILVDGVTKMSEKVELDIFSFLSEAQDNPLTLPEGDLLQTFVASTSIERLLLQVNMTLEQILSLLRSADVTRMYSLTLWAKGFDSVKVDAILDGLQHAKKLRRLVLRQSNIAEEQRSRMEAKGVSLI